LTSVEGAKEIEMALEGDCHFEQLYFEDNIADKQLLNAITKKFPNVEYYQLSADLFSKVSYRETTGGIIAVVKTKQLDLSELKLGHSPLILIVEGVEKPGNLGAILRTADAANIDAVICCNLPGDVFNPNIIRSSLGTIFTVQLAVCNNQEAMDFLSKHQIATYCSNLHKAKNYYEFDYTKASAIVVGTEATGVSKEWMDYAVANVKVPMLGKIDSMNVSVASAIMLYEAKRQRGF